MTFQPRRLQYASPAQPTPDAPACRSAEAAAVLWLAALGTAHRRPVDVAGLQDLLHGMGETWTPCQDVIVACVEEMLRAEALTLEPASGMLVPGPEGALLFARLMAAPPEPGPGPMGRLGTRLRLAFLDLLPAAERPQVLDGLLAAAEVEMKRTLGRADAWSGPYGGRWRLREMTEGAARLDLLRVLRAEATEAVHA